MIVLSFIPVLRDVPTFFLVQFTLKVIGNMIMSLEPSGEEQEKFRANFKLISSSFASLPFKIPGFAFHRGIKVMNLNIHENTAAG